MGSTTAPLLSICIPTYNRAGLLERMLVTLDAALARVPDLDYEVVFRDNASTDDTQRVIERFGESHPVKSFVNPENIGVTRNILKCSDGATGEFVWMLGDDDLVVPNALEVIHQQLQAVTKVDGHIACHALAMETQRDALEHQVFQGETPEGLTPLVRPGTAQDQLGRFEEFYRHTDVGTALNFLSNVIFRRTLWDEAKPPYEDHCIGREWFSDSITSSAYMWVWADFLVGKPVGLISSPLVIGFVGQQVILSKWPVLSMVFFLQVSQHYLRLGADPECVRLYQRSIYGGSSSLCILIQAEDEYTEKHFSLRKLISEYGVDPVLWQSLSRSIQMAKGRRNKLRVWLKITCASMLNPRYALTEMKFQIREFLLVARRVSGKVKKSFDQSYSADLKRLNQKAQRHFCKYVTCKSLERIEHPIYLKNPNYIQIGENFSTGPGLRLECWDRYEGRKHQPILRIGNRVCFNYNCHVGVINEVRVGNDVLIGSNVLITDHQHGNMADLVPGKTYKQQPLHSKGPVIIRDNVWIGENVAIMPGVSIGKNAVIGANAVVTHDVPANSIAVGNPATVIRTLEMD